MSKTVKIVKKIVKHLHNCKKFKNFQNCQKLYFFENCHKLCKFLKIVINWPNCQNCKKNSQYVQIVKIFQNLCFSLCFRMKNLKFKHYLNKQNRGGVLSESFIAKNMMVCSCLWSNLHLIFKSNIKDSTAEKFTSNF